MYLLLVFIVVLLVFSMWQSRKRRAQAQALHQAIAPGVRVMTTSGIYGIVTEVESDTMVIEISEGVDVRFAKQAVMRVVPHLDEGAEEASEAAESDGVSEADAVADADRADRVTAGSVEASRAPGHEKGSDAVPTT